MKRVVILVTLACLLHATLAVAGERRLHGQILRLDEENRRVPVGKNIKVVIDEIGATNYTEENGLFDYFLRDRDRPGKEITFRIGLDNHVIHEPLDGQTHIPKDSALDQLMRLLIVEKGSPALLSDARFNKTIQVATAEARDQIRQSKDKQPVQVKLEVNDPASKLGFTEEEFRQWIIEQAARLERSSDLQTKARAAAARNDFRKAGDLEMQAMDKLAAAYARAKPLRQHGPLWLTPPALIHLVDNSRPPSVEELERIALELVKGYRFAGHAYYNAYEFEQSLASYQRAARYVSKEDSPELWAEIQLDIGRASTKLGTRAESSPTGRFLDQAVAAYQAALTVFTQEVLPQEWAQTQNNLGAVLAEQGSRTSGEAGTQLLAQAVDTYRAALTVRTKEQLPQEWAQTQNNLGAVLAEQGSRTSGEAGTQLLAQAVDAHRDALTVYTKEQLPQEWAGTQNNFGIVLRLQSIRTTGETSTRLLAQAVDAYRDALTVYTKEALPQEWALTQNNLGAVLAEQGSRTSRETGTQLLAQAVDAYRAALTVRTKEHLPQQWAMTQNNLGAVLAEQGSRTSGETGIQLLAQAVDAHRAALTVHTKEQLPQQWAGTQTNLGAALTEQATRTKGETSTKFFDQAVEAYLAALTVYTKEQFPREWALNQTNLGMALYTQGMNLDGESGGQLLVQAVEAYRKSLEVLTLRHLPEDWVNTHKHLGLVAWLLEDWPTTAESYRNVLLLDTDDSLAYLGAHTAYQNRLFVYKIAFELSNQWVERHPDHLFAQTDFAEAHLTTARYEEAEERLGELLKKPDLAAGDVVRLRILDIINAIALKKADTVPQKLQELHALVLVQSETFHWWLTFAGTKHFVQTEPVFAPHRAWLNELFEVVKSENRAALLSDLDRLQITFKP